jgi:VIT1/CCC1 family predicted Fe2+/Mn2+ transporter
MPSKSPRERLPFEPRQKLKKSPKQQPAQVQKTGSAAPKQTKNNVSSIPEAVSKRMVRRMAFFSGVPTALGMASFVISYWIVSHQWFELPTAAVFYISLGFFGLGVLGLSYGIFSTSWDEKHSGSWLGWREFKLNVGRTLSDWRAAKKEASGN